MFAALVAVAFVPGVAEATTTVTGASDSTSPLVIDPETSPGSPVVSEISGGFDVAFIQSMPVTKPVGVVTIGDLSKPADCGGTDPQVYLDVFDHRSGDLTGNWTAGANSTLLAQVGPIDLSGSSQRLVFRLPSLTFQQGHGYRFSVFNSGGCNSISMTTWPHNASQVNPGPAHCAEMPYRDWVFQGGGFERQWHTQGVDDHAPCVNNTTGLDFDPSMPTGWLAIVSYNGWDHYVRFAQHAPGQPYACADSTGHFIAAGAQEVFWEVDPNNSLSDNWVCQWSSQFAPSGQTVADGWYYGLPWTSADTYRPRDTYLRLDLPDSAIASGSYGDPSGQMPGSYPVAPNLVPTHCKDPVDCATGNLVESHTDLGVGGRGLGLALTRVYNSHAAAAASSPGAFGYGWSAAYREYVQTDSITGMVTVHHADGSTARFAPNGDGTYSATAAFVQATLAKNADGSFTYTLPNRRSFHFDSSGRLQSEADRNANATTLNYSGSQLGSVTDPAGRSITFSYNGDGTVASATDPAGHVVNYGYSSGNLTSVTDVSNGVTQFGYDGSHQLTSITNPRGGLVKNTYDASNRVTSQTDPLGHTTAWQYLTNETKITAANVIVTDETFQNGQLASITRAQGTSSAATTTYAYDAALNRTKTTDPNGHSWSYGYDGQGNQTSVTDPLGHTTSRTYDTNRDVTSLKTPSGHQTQFGYDSHGNLTSVTRTYAETNTQAVTRFSYNGQGDRLQTTDPLNRSWSYGYDAYGDRTSATSPLGHKTTWTYDADSRIASITSARGNEPGANPASYTTQIQRDPLGNPTKITDPLGHATLRTYDANGNLTDSTDRDGRHTQTSYDANNQPAQVTRGDGSTQKTAYDADGHITAQTDGLGRQTKYGYDQLGRLTSLTDPLGRVQSYAYDPAGNRTSKVDQLGRTTSYSFDGANELTQITYSSGTPANVSYGYDADGHGTTMSDQSGSTTYAYDSLGRLASSTNGAGQKTSYGYDLADQLTSITYPPALVPLNLGGVQVQPQLGTGTVTRGYDQDGNLTTVADWLGNTTQFGYDAESNVTSATRPNGTAAAYSYDQNDALVGLNDVPGQTTHTRTAEELLALTSGAANQSYAYDGAARLTGLGNTSNAFQYDAADNPTQLSSGVGPTTVATAQTFDQANELTATQTATLQTTFGYDTAGERTSAISSTGSGRSYTYDQAGNLAGYTATAPNGSVTVQSQYTYDGTGLRQTKTVANQLTNETYDLSGPLPLMIEDATYAYVTGPNGLPLEQINAATGAVAYYSHDQLGSTTALSDQNGHTLAGYTYDPYGRVTSPSAAVTNPFQYAGQYTDAETGLQYLRARYYDPNTGQFIIRDPVASITRAPYSYGADSPLNAIDPTGLSCNINPFSGSFWSDGNCLSGAVGGPSGDSSGYSSQACLGGSISPFVFTVSVDVCFVSTPHGGGIAVSGSGSVGPGFGVNLHAGGGFSNACSPSDYAGPFGQVGASATGILGAYGNGFTNAGIPGSGRPIVGGNAGVTAGWGAEAGGGGSQTWVIPF